MDFHVLPPAGPELLMYVVDGLLVIVPAPAPTRQFDQFGKLGAVDSEKEKPSQ
jgi:hypothetical protein